MKFVKSMAPAFLILTLLLSSCIKPKDDDKDKSDVQQHNEDVNNNKNESDNLNTDVQNVLRNAPGFQKKEGVAAYDICGATVDDSHQYDAIPTLYINFNGASCGNPARKRSGQIKVELIFQRQVHQRARWPHLVLNRHRVRDLVQRRQWRVRAQMTDRHRQLVLQHG